MSKRKKKNVLPLILLLGAAIAAFFIIDLLKENVNDHKLGPPPAGFKSHGIDVSHYQKEIDWNTLFNSLDSIPFFVYCKATEGVTIKDNKWKKNRAYLLKNNKHHGAYHFYRSNKDPLAQAEFLLSVYEPNDNDLPVALDIEEQITYNYEKEDILIWLNKIESASGKQPIIYTSLHLYKTQLKQLFPEYKFWVAAYGRHGHEFQDDQIIHWQYSDKGKIPGIETSVDLNYSKIEF